MEQMVERDETYFASVILDTLKGFTDEAKQNMMCDAIAPPICSHLTHFPQC
jgi:hypothetical protein